jgi:Uma2 family endonuclease
MTTPGVRTKLVYEDLLDTPADGKRSELLEGDLYVTPAPSPLHQRTSKRLQRMLEAYFEARGIGEVFNAPLDVILTQQDVVEPDLLVVADPAQISTRAVEGPPLLVVEILSESTERTDRNRKAQRYAALGVFHYWIVDPRSRMIECYRLGGGRYQDVLRAGVGAEFRHPDWPELAIDTAALWAGA